MGSSSYCDAAVAFTNTPAAPVKWINKTGGDSLYSVAASKTDVYIGGHRAGLWVASDTYSYYGTTHCAGRYHPGICFFPGA